MLGRTSSQKLGMDVDEACRKLLELQQRLKTRTLEQVVDFHNDHGQRMKHGVANTVIYESERVKAAAVTPLQKGANSGMLARSQVGPLTPSCAT